MRKKQKMLTVLSYMILVAGLVWVALPFVWMVLTALKAPSEVLAMPPKWLPSELHWENFQTAFEAVPYVRYFWNSVFVAVMVTVGEVITSVFAAYAFSYLEFRGKQILFLILIATMMVPSEILMIPNYVTLSKFGWINSYKGLILPWCTSVFSIYLLKQQFDSVPISYYKSAKINGCSDFRFLFEVLIPCSVPTLASVALLKFINCWNSYMWPLITTNSREMRTLPVGMAAFSTEAGTRYHVLMAFSILVIAPVIILYFFTQKYIVKGVCKSGLKG